MLKEQLQDMCERYGVEILYAFGSRSREIRDLIEGKVSRLDGAFSDVDIGLKLRPGACLSIREKARLSVELENILNVNRVDLCDIHKGDPFVAVNIVRGERLFCRDEYGADEYELYVFRRAGDLAYLERERTALIIGASRAQT
jgi:hypothetical protein